MGPTAAHSGAKAWRQRGGPASRTLQRPALPVLLLHVRPSRSCHDRRNRDEALPDDAAPPAWPTPLPSSPAFRGWPVTEQPDEAALRWLHPLYIEMRNAELAATDKPELEQVRIMADALSGVIGRALDQDADAKELRKLVACMRAFSRIEFCRSQFPAASGRRQNIGDVLDTIAKLGEKLESTLRKLLDDSIRDIYSGAPIDTTRLEVARGLLLAMGRGWLDDIDPTFELGIEPNNKMRENLPSFSLEKPIPGLSTSLNSLTFLVRQAKTMDRRENNWVPSVNGGRDSFISDAASIFKSLVSLRATAWYRAGTDEKSGFFRFIETVWCRLEDVPFEGRAVPRGGRPDAKTLKRILDAGK